MKKIFSNITLIMMLLLCSNVVWAQNKSIAKDTITVLGSCGQCKSRIEDASYIKGVKSAEWNKKTKILSIVYNPKKTTLDNIALAITRAGHDNRLHNASDKNYELLPSCCAYRTGTCDHD